MTTGPEDVDTFIAAVEPPPGDARVRVAPESEALTMLRAC